MDQETREKREETNRIFREKLVERLEAGRGGLTLERLMGSREQEEPTEETKQEERA